MTLGQYIKNLRVKSGMTQEMLADKLNISRQAVAKWESNSSQPSCANLITLSKIFNVSYDKFLKISFQSKYKTLCITLFIASVIMIILFIITFLISYQNAVPENIIGYSDTSTQIYVTGTVTIPYIFLIIAIAAFISGIIIMMKNKAKYVKIN